MKKISYFGKEYTIGDDVKWVATCPSGNVIAFTEFPRLYCGTWVSHEDGKRIGIWGGATEDWENSLRKVEDIIVKKNELKIGDKVMVNRNINGFKKGQIVEVYRLDSDGTHLFKGDNDTFPRMCGIHDGAFLSPSEYTVIGDTKPHPHADLMLKYAMIAQYDDKPWECFEFKNEYSDGWMRVINPCWDIENEYRLKPQEPKIQIGQVWTSKEGVDVEVVTPAISEYVTTGHTLGGNKIHWSFLCSEFLQNFKRKV